MAAVYEALEAEAGARGLLVLGGFHPGAADGAPEGFATVLMLGPDEPAFWPLFRTSDEYRDGVPDPLDRWSKRVIGGWAGARGARAVFPSDGPPYPPFIAWAKATGRTHNSPVGALVHDVAGLMVSFRGALLLREHVDLPPAPPCPCNTCETRPCLTACPVAALAPGRAYDVPTCHAFLDTTPGQDCMTRGCAVRRCCPVSVLFGREEAQSAFHMRAFHRK